MLLLHACSMSAGLYSKQIEARATTSFIMWQSQTQIRPGKSNWYTASSHRISNVCTLYCFDYELSDQCHCNRPAGILPVLTEYVHKSAGNGDSLSFKNNPVLANSDQ